MAPMLALTLCALSTLVALLPVATPAPTVAPGTPPVADDPLPAALDALLLAPEDTVFFGVPDLADAHVVASQVVPASGRSLVAVGDLNGDGWSEFAVGDAPGAARTLAVRDGRTAALRWSASSGGGFRSLTGLASRGPWLAAGVSSTRTQVECRASATGALRWAKALAPLGATTPANVQAVLWLADLDDDGEDDLLVAGGRSIDAVVALAGSDGHVLWKQPTTGCATALAEAGDLDGDGRADVFVVGGSTAPFAAALSGAGGRPLWSVPLPAPGSAVLRLDDADADGLADLVVGLMHQPDACVLALSGLDGALLWTSLELHDDVTSLATISDVDRDGVRDFAVGSFDNAVAAGSGRTGENLWRREGSSNNTGAMLDVAAIGDVDGSGRVDVVCASVDHQLYVFDGEKGHPIAIQDLLTRGIAVAELPDGNADGRQEFVAASDGRVAVLGGDSGTALGPLIFFDLPGDLADETTVHAYALPQKVLLVMSSLGTGELELAGFAGEFGLGLGTLEIVHVGIAPAAGQSGYLLRPFPREFAGHTLYYQAVTLWGANHGVFGPRTSLVVPRR